MISSLARKVPILSYLEIVKPRETFLLVFIGACAGVIASNGYFATDKFLIIIIALLLGSAGSNGITNYLDRHVDTRMVRTKYRALPSQLIYPPEKSLLMVIPLILVALFLAWLVNPICFIIGLVGVLASSLWRKTITCTFFGIIAGCSPILIGWFAFNRSLNLTILLLCLLVVFWIPVHVWSVIVARRNEYLSAGLTYFPINLNTKIIVTMIFILNCLLVVVSICLYLFAGFQLLYLIVAVAIGTLMVIATGNLVLNTNSKISWSVYKLSSFPYLGLLFASMVADLLLR